MFYTVKIRHGLVLVLATVISLLTIPTVLYKSGIVPAAQLNHNNCLIIDPGHGGIDGGALSAAGDKESEINLSIALKLKCIAQLYGEHVVLTREDDASRTDALSYSEHEDLVYRTNIINSCANGVLVSIHQNCYPTSQPSGAQVLFSDDDNSRVFGSITHNNIIEKLQPENRRVAEPAPKKLFITSNAKCPAILVECGFMSNLKDIENLKNLEYQTKLSAVLFGSYIQFRYS